MRERHLRFASGLSQGSWVCCGSGKAYSSEPPGAAHMSMPWLAANSAGPAAIAGPRAGDGLCQRAVSGALRLHQLRPWQALAICLGHPLGWAACMPAALAKQQEAAFSCSHTGPLPSPHNIHPHHPPAGCSSSRQLARCWRRRTQVTARSPTPWALPRSRWRGCPPALSWWPTPRWMLWWCTRGKGERGGPCQHVLR